MANSLGKAVKVNQSAIRGEAGTGYEAENGLGEFECGNCKYLTNGKGGKGCNQSIMKAKSKLPRLPDGRVKIDGEGCCEYVWRVGRKDED